MMKQNDQAHPPRRHVPQSKKRILVLIFVQYVTSQTYLKISMLMDPFMPPNEMTALNKTVMQLKVGGRWH